MTADRPQFSVIVPVYNEESALPAFLEKLFTTLNGKSAEVIAVDDGSTDGGAGILERYSLEGKLKLVRHHRNRGYGASLKSGMRAASAEKVLIIDADGSYPLEKIPELMDRADNFEMVVAARKSGFKVEPLVRRIFKWLVLRMLHYLAGYEIPDLNSGLRVFNKELALKYASLLPEGFSLTSTITLIFLSEGFRIEYIPIDYQPREGKSKFRLSELSSLSLLLLRTIMYFNPLKFFIPLSLAVLALALAVSFFSIFVLHKFMDVTAVVLLVAAVQTFIFGLLADLLLRLKK
jgi:glycosyltransferase involved in cell wall biosynthesis